MAEDRAGDPRWANSEPGLVEAIRDEILAASDERMTFARFMQRALTEPGLGYYATSELRPTRDGDFLTSPELHPFFGRCVGRFALAVGDRAGDPEPFRILEYGAGRGALRDTAMAELDETAAWRKADLPDRSDEPGDPPHLVIANEYLDALPVHRLVMSARPREIFVTWKDGWFADAVGDPSTPDLDARLTADGVVLREGQRAEICLALKPWMAEVAAALAPGGVVLVVDYGHEAAELYGPRRLSGSLLTFRDHAVADDPYDGVGRTDITAHVDFTALEQAAGSVGLVRLGSTTQATFLSALGLGEMLVDMGRRPETDMQDYATARSAVARLVDPRHLGGFSVVAWGRADDDTGPALPGFAGQA